MKRSVVSSILVMASLNAQQGNVADQLHCYFVANYQHFAKLPQAFTMYQRALEVGCPHFAYKGLIHFLRDTNNDALIVQFKSLIETSFSQDEDMLFMLAQALANTNNLQESDDIFIKLNQKNKKHPEIAYYTAQIYLRRQEPENAILVVDALLNAAARKPNHFIFHFMKSQIYMQLNKFDEALNSITTSLDLHPRFEKGWLMLALLQEKAERLDEAIKGYTNFLDIAGSNKEIEQHLLTLMFKQKVAGNIQASVPIPQNQTSMAVIGNDTLTQALQLFSMQKYMQALPIINQYIHDHPDHLEAKVLKIQILSALDDIPQALQALKSWIVQEPDQPIWYSTIHLLYRNGADIHVIIKTLHELEKKLPEHLLPMLYLADAYVRTQSTHAATTYLKRALQKTNNAAFKSALIFQLGALYYDNKQYKQLKELYRHNEELAQKDSAMLNLVAYYYAQKEHNFALAQTLITEALALDLNNPHILDTQAVIYYQQGEIDQALAILEKISHQEPHDTSILKHLARAYHRKGNLEQATTTLQKLIDLTKDGKKQELYQRQLLGWNSKKR